MAHSIETIIQDPTSLRRGDVLLVELAPRSGSEQQGIRPALLVSHDVFNSVVQWRSLIVIPLSTSEAQARRGPTSVPLKQGLGGLSRDSVALCHQITTIDRQKVIKRLGRLPRAILIHVANGIKAALDLE